MDIVFQQRKEGVSVEFQCVKQFLYSYIYLFIYRYWIGYNKIVTRYLVWTQCANNVRICPPYPDACPKSPIYMIITEISSTETLSSTINKQVT